MKITLNRPITPQERDSFAAVVRDYEATDTKEQLEAFDFVDSVEVVGDRAAVKVEYLP